VRARIDWKYALSLELTDPGFDHTEENPRPVRFADYVTLKTYDRIRHLDHAPSVVTGEPTRLAWIPLRSPKPRRVYDNE
jgi:hypothetical protein